MEEIIQDAGDEEVAKCASCMNIIEENEFFCALGQDWHTDCFRCSACDEALNHWYFEKDGLLFCKNDYLRKFGEACQQCGEIITGPVMVAGEHKFHPECFSCSVCQLYIGDGESYALVERSKLFCGVCYKLEMQPIPNKGVPCNRKTHRIQLIELPPISDGPRTIKLTADPNKINSLSRTNNLKAFRIADVCSLQKRFELLDSVADLASLHIGDRILEVNGKPVDDFCIEELENLISTSKLSIQLTIEHDPSQLFGRRQSFPFTNHLRDQKGKNKTHGLREQLFKKKDEGILTSSHRSRQPRRGFGSKERSTSLPKFFNDDASKSYENDLSRTHSFRREVRNPRIFRASDLLKGDFLGKGFFGTVYQVTDLKSGEVMVLKELYRVDEKAQKNFLKEVAVLRSLSHKNVLGFIGVLYKDKKLHLVTEFISGGTLKALIHAIDEELSWTQRISFGRDIAAGMTYLHAKDIIHRDLNSHNCLIREDKTVVVADFGLARILPQNNWTAERKKFGKRHIRKKRYTVVGNPYWMAPEMMKGNKYDEKVDIFSFGIILCEMIGRVEADPDYMPRSFDFGLNETVFMSNYCEQCPPPFYKMAFLCCQTNPDKRPPFDALELWLESLTLHCEDDDSIPFRLLDDIDSFNGQSGSSSESSTPDTVDGTRTPLLLRTISENVAHTTREGSPNSPKTLAKEESFAERSSLKTFAKEEEASRSSSLKTFAKEESSKSSAIYLSNGSPIVSCDSYYPVVFDDPIEGCQSCSTPVQRNGSSTIQDPSLSPINGVGVAPKGLAIMKPHKGLTLIKPQKGLAIMKPQEGLAIMESSPTIPITYSPVTKKRSKNVHQIEQDLIRSCCLLSIDDQLSLVESTHL